MTKTNYSIDDLYVDTGYYSTECEGIKDFEACGRQRIRRKGVFTGGAL